MNIILLISGLIFHFSNTPKHFIFPLSNNNPSSLNIPNSNKFTDYKHYSKNCFNNGMDERYYYRVYDEPNTDTELMNIQETFTKSKLLKYLENTEVSVPDKIEAIKDYEFIYKKSSLSTDIKAGGLMDDWNFELDP
jgi:hypothetical protein